MSMISYISDKVRNIIGDFAESKIDPFVYVSSNVFTLSNSNNVVISQVTVNDVSTDQLSGVDYSFDSSKNQVTVTGLTVNDIIKVYYTYNDYSDTEITGYINASLDYINMFSDKEFSVESGDNISPTPTTQEKSLIAIVASILAQPNYTSYNLPNLVVRFPTKMTKEERVGQLVYKFYSTDGDLSLIEITDSGS